MFVASGCDEYQAKYGNFPASLAELHTLREDLSEPWTQDAWERHLIISPYNKSLGYGRIISYGRDGKPGGNDNDKDLEVRFPLTANEEWNRSVGNGLEKPRFRP
jgi:hypothetical protein